MGGRGSSPTIEVDQCEEMDKMLKEEYGDDYKTNREKFPLTSQALGMLASTPCESYFGYENLVREYCADIKNFTDQIGNGQTCADRLGTAERKKWCIIFRISIHGCARVFRADREARAGERGAVRCDISSESRDDGE